MSDCDTPQQVLCERRLARIEQVQIDAADQRDSQSRLVREIHHVVCGNGEPGLNERVRNLEALNKRGKTRRQLWLDRAWKMLVAAVLVVFGYIVKELKS